MSSTGDFYRAENRDGLADLVMANLTPLPSHGLHILLGTRGGLSHLATTYDAGRLISEVVLEDFDGDGKPDIGVSNQGSYLVSVLQGNGDGTFQRAANFVAPGGARSIATGDFNRDGKPDLATVAPWENELAILLNDSL